jgi:hypothetical protein
MAGKVLLDAVPAIIGPHGSRPQPLSDRSLSPRLCHGGE